MKSTWLVEPGTCCITDEVVRPGPQTKTELPKLSGAGLLERFFVFAARWATPPFHFLHPGGRTTAPFTPASGKAFKGYDRFFQLLSFLAKFRQHLHDIHFVELR